MSGHMNNNLANAMLLAMAYTDQPPTNEALRWVWNNVIIMGEHNFNHVLESPAENKQVREVFLKRWGVTREQLYDMAIRSYTGRARD